MRRRVFFFFSDAATTDLISFPLRAALPIFAPGAAWRRPPAPPRAAAGRHRATGGSRAARRRARGRDRPRQRAAERSEEHTSELQSPCNLVRRLLLAKQNKTNVHTTSFAVQC